MTLASYISCLRIVLIVPIIYLLHMGFWLEPSFYNYLAFSLFLLAGITDYLDGYIARKTDTETRVGALLDLIADKLLVSIIMVWLVFLIGNPWVTFAALIIVSRELVISTLRQHIIEKSGKNKLSVSFVGKSKTTIQIIGISMLISLVIQSGVSRALQIRQIGDLHTRGRLVPNSPIAFCLRLGVLRDIPSK